MDEIYIDKGRSIGKGNSVFITLDIGKNFIDTQEVENNKILLINAKHLIDTAISCKVDAVKFQTHIFNDEQRETDIKSPHFDEKRYEWLKRNTFPKEWWKELKDYADKKGIIFYSTPMSIAAADLLEEISVNFFKIGSADVTDVMLARHIAKKGKPIILSSGMSTLEELKETVKVILEHNKNLIVMHCVSEYPCLPKDLNLNVIPMLMKEFNGIPIGLSDHVLEYETTYAAVALGAVAIEKHFTLDRKAYGPDHKVSLLPDEVTKMVNGIRIIEESLGSGKKILSKGESGFRKIFHKSIVARKNIVKDQIITEDMITAKRPSGGIPPRDSGNIIGKKAKRDIDKGELIQLEDIIS